MSSSGKPSTFLQNASVFSILRTGKQTIAVLIFIVSAGSDKHSESTGTVKYIHIAIVFLVSEYAESRIKFHIIKTMYIHGR